MIEQLPNSPILVDTLNSFVFQRLKKEALAGIQDIEKSFNLRNNDLLSMFHQDLPKEIFFKEPKESKDALEKEILRLCEQLINVHPEYLNVLSYFSNYGDDTNTKTELFVERFWINYQRPGEFIPLHQHSGVFSFVVWVQIPYLFESENDSVNEQYGASKNNKGIFEFVYNDALGAIKKLQLEADKRWEGKIAVFPANLYHQVYPFYENELRISVSGNVRARLI